MIFVHTNVKYDNFLDKFEFERSGAKVKVLVADFRKTLCHYSSAFIYRLILILYYTNVEYDNILNKFEFERSKAKVKATAAIFIKKKTKKNKTLSSL